MPPRTNRVKGYKNENNHNAGFISEERWQDWRNITGAITNSLQIIIKNLNKEIQDHRSAETDQDWVKEKEL